MTPFTREQLVQSLGCIAGFAITTGTPPEDVRGAFLQVLADWKHSMALVRAIQTDEHVQGVLHDVAHNKRLDES